MACIIGRPLAGGSTHGRPALLGRSSWRAPQGTSTGAVTDALKSLPDHFIAFCSFDSTSGQHDADSSLIDYVLVGPTGVFAIASAEHSVNVVEPAPKNAAVRRHVVRVEAAAAALKEAIAQWSGGALADLNVVPVVAYTHTGAFIVNPREGDTRVIPVKWLRAEALDERKNDSIGPQAAWRIARMLFLSLAEDDRAAFDSSMRACGLALEELARWVPATGTESLGLERS